MRKNVSERDGDCEKDRKKMQVGNEIIEEEEEEND